MAAVGTLPVAMVAPVMTVPATVMPAPVAAMPVAMPMTAVVPMTVAVVVPAHLFGLDVIDIVLRHDRRLGACACGHRR